MASAKGHFLDSMVFAVGLYIKEKSTILQSNSLNTDTERDIENDKINRESILSRLNLEKMY